MVLHKYCKHLDSGKICRHGCIKINGQAQYVCHQFMRGRCRHSKNACRHGLHYAPQKTTPTEARGTGFRPNTIDTAEENKIKQYLGTLGLSPFCENLLDLDVDLLHTIYRKLALHRHPDKNPNEASAARFRELTEAKDYIEKHLPFKLSPG